MTAAQQDGWAIKLVKDANLRLAMKEVLIEESRGPMRRAQARSSQFFPQKRNHHDHLHR